MSKQIEEFKKERERLNEVIPARDNRNIQRFQVKEAGVTDKEFDEAISIGLVVGGSITIPHIRRAYQTWKELSE